MSGYTVLDIETAPQARALALPYPEGERNPPGNYKNADAIERWREKDRAEWSAGLSKVASLNPRLGRVVALGNIVWDATVPEVSHAIEEEEERELVAWGLDKVGRCGGLITFNGLGFDLPFLHVRAAILGVRVPYKPSDYLRRYTTKPHADLQAILSNWSWGEKGDTLHGWCEAFGIPVEDQTTGADIAEDVARGDAEAVCRHCGSDVLATAALYERLRDAGLV